MHFVCINACTWAWVRVRACMFRYCVAPLIYELLMGILLQYTVQKVSSSLQLFITFFYSHFLSLSPPFSGFFAFHSLLHWCTMFSVALVLCAGRRIQSEFHDRLQSGCKRIFTHHAQKNTWNLIWNRYFHRNIETSDQEWCWFNGRSVPNVWVFFSVMIWLLANDAKIRVTMRYCVFLAMQFTISAKSNVFSK